MACGSSADAYRAVQGGKTYLRSGSHALSVSQCEISPPCISQVDIIISTALIPGRTAPIMVTKEMVSVMRNGSVTVDLAAESGGNIETTVADQKTITPNGVTCLGYTDLPSRLPTTSSSLYANNISKFLLSVGPQTTKEPGYFHIDHDDEAVRGMLVVEDGKLMYPPPTPVTPPQLPPKQVTPEVTAVEVDYRAKYVSGAKNAAATAGAILAFGAVAPNPAFSSMFTTFALSNIIGVQVVLGVTHALHSPLMAVTNAISGTTALGGMHLLAHSTGPMVSLLGAAATTLSTVNIVGTRTWTDLWLFVSMCTFSHLFCQVVSLSPPRCLTCSKGQMILQNITTTMVFQRLEPWLYMDWVRCPESSQNLTQLLQQCQAYSVSGVSQGLHLRTRHD